MRALEVDLYDFNTVIHQDIIKILTEKAYEKLFTLREKLLNEHEKRNKIELMDPNTAFQAKTVNHMQTIFPSSTLNYQKRANKILKEKAKNNPFKIISLADGRREGLNKGQKTTYKTEIHNSQRQIFAEYDRIKNTIKESKTYHVRRRTLFSLDH